ncbi:aspartyl protease [Nostoc linckia z18]|uniref:Aspartyl protease n=2 Tax=Nostoc linckia TaxID=92942 RepID=A0A9Q5ZHI3_NOSLI|nr:aspartyl protease [Nostoc linckia]PHK35380.1 aspartyl protease [Nostoc linckia z15]PHK45961.1 aspartyl protease [Nostoc linckia z16]PHJ68001.1 aspartyl protease [Nostoc linckia z1]PHJ72939.1 aspartyl protease [Nostoc linckia z3]PHJ77405.1 aspartyl protease [Nostoc linckia z2]
MIEGRFGENGQIYFEIDLIGKDGISFPVETMLDTGFTEFLAMNKQDVQSLEWDFLNQDKLRTAQGETEFDVYSGRIIIDNQEWEIPVFAGDEIQEILLGSQWLKLLILVANYNQNLATLELI